MGGEKGIFMKETRGTAHEEEREIRSTLVLHFPLISDLCKGTLCGVPVRIHRKFLLHSLLGSKISTWVGRELVQRGARLHCPKGRQGRSLCVQPGQSRSLGTFKKPVL